MAEPFIQDYRARWFDVATRRRVAPPPELAALWMVLPRTEDFAVSGPGGRGAP